MQFDLLGGFDAEILHVRGFGRLREFSRLRGFSRLGRFSRAVVVSQLGMQVVRALLGRNELLADEAGEWGRLLRRISWFRISGCLRRSRVLGSLRDLEELELRRGLRFSNSSRQIQTWTFLGGLGLGQVCFRRFPFGSL